MLRRARAPPPLTVSRPALPPSVESNQFPEAAVVVIPPPPAGAAEVAHVVRSSPVFLGSAILPFSLALFLVAQSLRCAPLFLHSADCLHSQSRPPKAVVRDKPRGEGEGEGRTRTDVGGRRLLSPYSPRARAPAPFLYSLFPIPMSLSCTSLLPVRLSLLPPYPTLV